MEVDSEEFPILLLYYDRPPALNLADTYSNIINPYQDSKSMNPLERDTWTFYGKSPELRPKTALDMLHPNQLDPLMPIRNEFSLNFSCDHSLNDCSAIPIHSTFSDEANISSETLPNDSSYRPKNTHNNKMAFHNSIPTALATNGDDFFPINKLDNLDQDNDSSGFNIGATSGTDETVPITKIELASITERCPIFFPNKQESEENFLSNKTGIDQNCFSSNASTKDESDNLSETSNPPTPPFNDLTHHSNSPILSSNVIYSDPQETQEICKLNLSIRNLVPEVCESSRAILPKISNAAIKKRPIKLNDRKRKRQIKKQSHRTLKKPSSFPPIKAKTSIIPPQTKNSKTFRLSTNLSVSKVSSTPTHILTRHRTRSGLKPMTDTNYPYDSATTNLKSSTIVSIGENSAKKIRVRKQPSKLIKDNPEVKSSTEATKRANTLVCNKQQMIKSKKLIKKGPPAKNRPQRSTPHTSNSICLKKMK